MRGDGSKKGIPTVTQENSYREIGVRVKFTDFQFANACKESITRGIVSQTTKS